MTDRNSTAGFGRGLRFPRVRSSAIVVLSFVFCAFTVCVGAILGKELLSGAAEDEARRVINELRLDGQTTDMVAIRLTAEVHSRWATTNPGSPSLLWRLRHYLTHDLIPPVFRLPKGIIEVLVPGGECDSNARRLIYMLEAAGHQGSQLNIVTKFGSGHSVVLAHLPDGRDVILDPHFGIVPLLAGELLSPSRAFDGDVGADIWHKLAPTSQDWFYKRFLDRAVFAVQNSPLEIRSEVKLTDNVPIVLGQRDGDSSDVGHDGSTYGLTTYWTYIGRKYDKGWTRVLQFHQDTRVEIGLTGPANEGFITTAARPRVQGETLVYVVASGDSLAFTDRLAERDWGSLKSFQEIDYIRFSSAAGAR